MIIQSIHLFQALIFPKLAHSKATLAAYIPALDEEVKFRTRKTILILPGGGYEFCSEREGEPIAQYFLAKGYNAYVLEYSTTRKGESRFPIQLLEAMAALKYIKDHAQESYGDANDIHVIGFSAGGHLAGSLAFLGNTPAYKKLLGIDASTDLSIKSLILGYPVISAMIPTHQRSFANIESTEYPKEMLSLERYVTDKAPPMFVFATSDDNAVPIVNSLTLCNAYAALQKPFELHIYEKGPHGFSLANDIVYEPLFAKTLEKNIPHWIDLAHDFIQRQ